ncbi:MAG: hypothetical protein GQ574_28370 [Crocinitomix sp.]|nr:hypothetical protein [Crocinitomix sp.]
MELWTDVQYLRNYAKVNNVSNINDFVNKRIRDTEQIDDLIKEILTQKKDLGAYFMPYHNQEYRGDVILSLRKGKHKSNGLRMYAIKVHDNCYAITSGAIKMSQITQERKDTDEAVQRLKMVQNYLKEEGIIVDDSFYSLLNELE